PLYLCLRDDLLLLPSAFSHFWFCFLIFLKNPLCPLCPLWSRFWICCSFISLFSVSPCLRVSVVDLGLGCGSATPCPRVSVVRFCLSRPKVLNSPQSFFKMVIYASYTNSLQAECVCGCPRGFRPQRCADNRI